MPNKTKLDECECCGYKTTLQEYQEGTPRLSYWLCEVCANTYLAKAVAYPTQCVDSGLYKSIAWIANRLLDEIRKGKAGA